MTAWWRRSNKGWPIWRSSDWMRRVSAGEDKASASAAAFTEPRRATWTKASIAVRGGSLRISARPLQLALCTATAPRSAVFRGSQVQLLHL
jgi:hypothetical protein